jgi:transaldolase
VGQHEHQGPGLAGHPVRKGAAARSRSAPCPDVTLEAFFDHGEVGGSAPSRRGRRQRDAWPFAQAGVDLVDVAAKLQSNGAKSFVDAWNELMDRITAQTSAVT